MWSFDAALCVQRALGQIGYQGLAWYAQWKADAAGNPRTVPSAGRMSDHFSITARIGEAGDPWLILWRIDDASQTIRVDYFGPDLLNRR